MAGIDTYIWIHKGIFNCQSILNSLIFGAVSSTVQSLTSKKVSQMDFLERADLVLSNIHLIESIYETIFLYCYKRIEMLLQNGIKVLCVFDGDKHGLKGTVENNRHENRKICKEKAV